MHWGPYKTTKMQRWVGSGGVRDVRRNLIDADVILHAGDTDLLSTQASMHWTSGQTGDHIIQLPIKEGA